MTRSVSRCLLLFPLLADAFSFFTNPTTNNNAADEDDGTTGGADTPQAAKAKVKRGPRAKKPVDPDAPPPKKRQKKPKAGAEGGEAA